MNLLEINNLLMEIRQQEESLQWPVFNEALAWELGCTLQQAAELNQAAVHIEIEAFGRLLFACAMPGTKRRRRTCCRRASYVCSISWAGSAWKVLWKAGSAASWYTPASITTGKAPCATRCWARKTGPNARWRRWLWQTWANRNCWLWCRTCLKDTAWSSTSSPLKATTMRK